MGSAIIKISVTVIIVTQLLQLHSIAASKVSSNNVKNTIRKNKKNSRVVNTAPQLLGKCGAWKAYKKTEDGQEVFFMVSFPVKSSGKYTKRGKVYALITHRPSIDSYNVFTHSFGYNIHNTAEITATVESVKSTHSLELFSEGENAWCIDDATDEKAANIITKLGTTMTIRGSSSRGTKTTDYYSLRGSLKAYTLITNAAKKK